MGAGAGKGMVSQDRAVQAGLLLAALHEYQQAHSDFAVAEELSAPNFKRRLYAAVEFKTANTLSANAHESKSLMVTLQSLNDADLSALQRYLGKKDVVASSAGRIDSRDNMAGDVDDNTSVLSYGDEERDDDEERDFFESSTSLVHSVDLDSSPSATATGGKLGGTTTPGSTGQSQLAGLGVAGRSPSLSPAHSWASTTSSDSGAGGGGGGGGRGPATGFPALADTDTQSGLGGGGGYSQLGRSGLASLSTTTGSGAPSSAFFAVGGGANKPPSGAMSQGPHGGGLSGQKKGGGARCLRIAITRLGRLALRGRGRDGKWLGSQTLEQQRAPWPPQAQAQEQAQEQAQANTPTSESKSTPETKR